jgi:excinuclease ABC subunit A
VLVVEHDEETIRHADYVLDLGPGAGRLGGYVVAQGTPAEIMACPESLTGRYLSGATPMLQRAKPRPSPASGSPSPARASTICKT